MTRDLEAALREARQALINVGHCDQEGMMLFARIDAALSAASGEHLEPTLMTEEQVKHMVDRFLSWRLPKNFNPDNGISYKRPKYDPSIDATPSGTNLFDAGQATEMVRYMIEGLSAASGEASGDEPWRRCPSTHCERRQECASPSDCIVKSLPAPSEAPNVERARQIAEHAGIDIDDYDLFIAELAEALDSARAEGITAERERILRELPTIIGKHGANFTEIAAAIRSGAKP